VNRILVERAQQGDRDAYEQLARSSARRLFLVASRILRDNDAAEDAVQQTLVSIWRDLPTLRDPDRFEAWTYRIVVRQCRAEARRGRRMRVDLVDISDSMAAEVDAIAAVDIRDELGRAFDALSQDHRTVVVLHHMVGLPLAEIAEILDVPYGTVGSRLHHATRALRTALGAPMQPPVTEGQLA
jgi:RNA polymerase sigma-70 factor (ECF subfamily)